MSIQTQYKARLSADSPNIGLHAGLAEESRKGWPTTASQTAT